MASAARKKGPPPAARLKQLEALFLDCDGVLTTGALFYDEMGKRLLAFDARDGMGLALLARKLKVAVISGRPVDIARARHAELGVAKFVERAHDKWQSVHDVCAELGVAPEQTAYLGDDLPDLPAFAACGLSIAVGDAAPEVRAAARWVTKSVGGRGALREVAEAILKARGDWQRAIEKLSRSTAERRADG